MAASVALSCDREYRYGKCPAQVRVFDVATVEQAREVARTVGWHYSPAGERCPTCAGTRAVAGPAVMSGRHPL